MCFFVNLYFFARGGVPPLSVSAYPALQRLRRAVGKKAFRAKHGSARQEGDTLLPYEVGGKHGEKIQRRAREGGFHPSFPAKQVVFPYVVEYLLRA